MESGKLLTQDGGSGTWQGALQYAVGVFFRMLTTQSAF